VREGVREGREGSEGAVPCGELDQGILQRLPDLQQEGLILAQRVVPVLDVVPQRILDHLGTTVHYVLLLLLQQP